MKMHDMRQAEKRINELKKQINKLDFDYYVKAESILPDYEYDKLFAELVELEKQFPEFITPDSPTQKVAGEPLAEFQQVTHSIPMLSLSNTYSFDDVKNFDKRITSGLEGEEFDYCVEMKFDGVSISLKYVDGLFYQAVTRGNGIVGDDVTQNIKTIKNLPLKVNPVFVDGVELKDFEVRGEIYINDADFLKINQQKEEENEKTYANARNLTAGSIKLLDAKEVAKRPLQIVCYYLFTSDVKLKNQSGNLQILKELGFPISDIARICKDTDAVFNFINEWQYKRFDLGFQTDGMVVKLNNLRQQDYLGSVGRSPRWAFAYKFEPETAETILKDITLQVGRTGTITPVAELEPVLLAGSTISRATLHNSDFIEQLDLHIGDTVCIEKGGDVIPKVTKVVLNKRLHNSSKYEFPSVCTCELKSPIHRIEGEANYYCEHPDCPWQIRRRIEHFASKNAMDIAGLGEKVVDKLVSLGFIKNVADVYELNQHQKKLKTIDGWGEKSIDKLLTAIEQSKNQPFHRFLFAVGIRFVGEKIAKILCKHYNSINELQEAKLEDLIQINEIGERIANSIVNFFQDANEKLLIERLLNYGLQLENEAKHSANNFLENKTFVFTGELKSMTRTEAAKRVEEFGGKESKSVSKKTSYVVVGENAGNKYDKAISLKVPILTEAEFIELLKL